MNKRTKWYIRELPNYSINVNLVTSCEFQMDGAHITYVEGDSDDPLYQQEVSAVVSKEDIAFSYTECANRIREILKKFDAQEGS